jgi:hypothetical protein
MDALTPAQEAAQALGPITDAQAARVADLLRLPSVREATRCGWCYRPLDQETPNLRYCTPRCCRLAARQRERDIPVPEPTPELVAAVAAEMRAAIALLDGLVTR